MPQQLPADNERKQTRGKRLSFPAATWNKMQDAVRRHTRERFGGGVAGPHSDQIRPSTTVLVANGLTDLVDYYWWIVGIGDSSITPDGDDGMNLLEGYVFEAAEPTPDGAFAVLQAPSLTAGSSPSGTNEIVPGIVQGVATCWVLMNDAGHEWARPLAVDDPDRHKCLESVAGPGPARILWTAGEGVGVPPVTGAELAVVLIHGAGEGLPPACRVLDDGSVTTLDFDGSPSPWVGGPTVVLPEAGTYLVSWSVRAELTVGGTTNAYSSGVIAWGRLYNCSSAAAVGPEHVILQVQQNLGSPLVNWTYTDSLGVSQLVTVGGASHIQAQFHGVNNGGTTGLTVSGGVRDVEINYVKVSAPPDAGCVGSGCVGSGGEPGSGDGGNPGGGDPESSIDFGETADLTISDATGDCTCLNGETATLTKVSSTQWNGAGEIDSSGCPENPDATDNVGIAWSGDGWRLVGLYDGFDCEFLGQDDATLTVMIRCTATAGVGQSVCTGTFVVTVVGVP
jgi:hypothetical protein